MTQKVQEIQPPPDPLAGEKSDPTVPLSPDQFNAAVGWIEADKRRSAEIPSIAVDILKESYTGESWQGVIAVFAACFITYLLRWIGLGIAWCFPIWVICGKLCSTHTKYSHLL